MTRIKQRSNRNQSQRSLWWAILGCTLALVALSAIHITETSQAQGLPMQVLSLPDLSNTSHRSALAANQIEPYDVIVNIDQLNPNPVLTGQPVSVTASVVADPSGAGIPTGQLVIQAGQNKICQFTLDPSGAGSCSLTFTTIGLTPLQAIYTGQSPFLPGVSDVVYLTIESAELSQQPNTNGEE